MLQTAYSKQYDANISMTFGFKLKTFHEIKNESMFRIVFWIIPDDGGSTHL
jgi:hypothetical protein